MFPEQQILMLVVPHFVYRDCMFSASFAGRTVRRSPALARRCCCAREKDQIINIIYKRERDVHVPATASHSTTTTSSLLARARKLSYSTYIFFVYIKKFSMYTFLYLAD